MFRFGSGSSRRRRLTVRLRRWIKLAREVRARRLLIDGSFVTAKQEPNDIVRIMIANAAEYLKAQEELRSLEQRLARLQETHPVGSKGFTKAGIRKIIARLHEEMAVYEGSEEARQTESK